ncbi:MAG: hypothetical protein KF802_06585 [Bdellovibrionaceae bacterium]|nr:hypothetical protein [Pseudobdellovibrionaceae bacterium]MBX3034427.1 hypothetical protein [Pseudobdellovibrionaceae bacterium]
MLKVGPLLKFLSDLNPQNTPARLAFYNWLKGSASPEEPLSHALLERFFWDCMDYPHWASNKTQLGHEIRFLIENFNNFFQQKFDLSDLRFPESLQVIEIENVQDIIETLTCHLNQRIGADDKFRIINDQNKKFIALVLRADRSLEARLYDRKFTLRGGLLEPLRPDLGLFYTPGLELSPHHQHKIEIAPYITAQFTYENGLVKGTALRGFVFQNFFEMKNDPLREHARLHLPIRRLEQFFLDRRTDTEYQELVQKLERTRSLAQAGDVEAQRWSSTILSQAEAAMEQIYQGDRLLALLIRDLRHTLKLEGSKECPTLAPINPSV